ncbi:uncharacterized protein LOC117200819 isoform X4 [Orcinus orca]|uniref:uncharacterized protein LOC117200819 isoform X4 n=1 Tax=Orcinus orca TaxID=9733 RepID=UPI002111A4B3|nr:uncharacterized protein LOC117200819 isoform X4 [Orcinus orca]
MQAGACCSFEWALTALVGHQFQPKLPTGTTHHCAFCLKKHRRGETAASDLIPCPRKVPSNSSYTVMLALPGKFLLLLCRLPSPSEVFIKYSSLEEVVLCSKEEKGDNWLVQLVGSNSPPGMEPAAPAVGARSLNHHTARGLT